MSRPTTADWARAYGISIDRIAPAIEGYNEPCRLEARQIATRAVILQGVVAVASNVDPKPVLEWFRDQRIWDDVTPHERAFLAAPQALDDGQLNSLRWQVEAEWTLLWVVSQIEFLGLPTSQCDSRRLVDEIIPALGSDLAPFLAHAKLRPPPELLAEVDRHYDIWCRFHQTRRESPDRLPHDLNVDVLRQREYALNWIDGIEEWDNVQCDA